MTLSDLIQQARQGDPQALARLISDSLATEAVIARADWQGDQLHITLESDRPLDRQVTVPLIRRGFLRLDLQRPAATVHLYSCRVGQTFPDWSEDFILAPGASDSAPVSPLPQTASQAMPHSEPTYLSDTALVALAHLVPLFSYFVAMGSLFAGIPGLWGAPFVLPWRIVAPLVLLLTKGQESRFISVQTKEALNFQISMVIYWGITLALMFILIGFAIAPLLALLEAISIIVATVRASEGKPFRYPLTIRFVR